ncbi:MAG: HAD-IG family 5'-nucleotidase [Bradymonadia bacterium]
MIFCNRTLNLRSIKAIGYDMDYTLVHYHVEEWERRAYQHMQAGLVAKGWPVGELKFDPQQIIRGLIIDLEEGNLVKANRFGYVKQAYHGTQRLDFDAQRRLYARTVVDLSEDRWASFNTLFSLSEGCMYAQVVDLFDAGKIPGVVDHRTLYRTMKASLDNAHMEGTLKAEIMADPEAFVDLDPEIPMALLDQYHAGKKLLLITNSGWPYTRFMMEYAFSPFLPEGMHWRDLFEVVIVSASKPRFFTEKPAAFEVKEDDNLLHPPPGRPGPGKIIYGGHAELVEQQLGLRGSEILYVGDHIYGDVRVSKRLRRWRTALVLREMEAELAAKAAFAERQAELSEKMAQKVELEHCLSEARLRLQRCKKGYGLQAEEDEAELARAVPEIRSRIVALDEAIAPLAIEAQSMPNPLWGSLTHTGNDKSMLARQIERHADIYMARVSNFLEATPYAFFRSHRGVLPHD